MVPIRAGLVLSLLLLAPPWVRAVQAQQPTGPEYGVAAGPVRAVQLRDRAADSDAHAGFAVGAWVDAPTPVGWLSVLAEAGVARRGGEYEEGPGLPTAVVDVDYLAVAVLPSASVGLGPATLRVFAGPSLDVHLRSQAAVPLQQLFREPATQVLAGVVGAGAALSVGRATFHLEVRRHEQLTSAYGDDLQGLRHRSTEVVFRLGMKPRP